MGMQRSLLTSPHLVPEGPHLHTHTGLFLVFPLPIPHHFQHLCLFRERDLIPHSFTPAELRKDAPSP